MGFSSDFALSAVLDHAEAGDVVRRFVPEVVNSPLLVQLRSAAVGLAVGMDPLLKADRARETSFWSALEAIDDTGASIPRPERPARLPRDDYEGDEVARGSARLRPAETGSVWAACEIVVDGPAHGNPFVDVDFSAEFRLGDEVVRVGGFYDGEGVYRARFLPTAAGIWSVTTASTARSLDGLSGSVAVRPAEEMTRRFWEGAVRGGYVGHGETYLNDREELCWSKGGELIGQSPARIAFLRRIIAEMPDGRIDPLPSDWDVPWGGSQGVQIVYFGFNRPRFRTIVRDPADEWIVDVIDTWNITVTRVPGVFSGSFRIDLPARQFMAIRLTRVAS